MARLSEYPVITKTDHLRIEINSKEKLQLTVSHTAPGSSLETVVFSRLVDLDRRIRVPSDDEWLSLPHLVGKHTLTFSATTNTSIEKQSFTLLFVGEVVDSSYNTKLLSRSLNTGNTPPSDVAVVSSTSIARLDHATKLLRDTQSFLELEFLGASGINVFKESAPGVVKILTDDGTGSGAILNEQGVVVTNWHVIKDINEVLLIIKPPKGIEYTFTNIFAADVTRIDEKHDLALLTFRKPPSDLTALPLGTLRDVTVAMDVHAIGHPGRHNWSYTSGTVSQVRPEHSWGYGEEYPDGFEATVIQTQTPTNPGNSGGPLLSDDGKLIGINSFGDPKAQGINFAVAVNHIKDLMTETTSPVTSSRPEPAYLGSVDMSENGVDDMFVFDTDHNGIGDLFAIDENEDAKPDYWLLDENENEKFDGKIIVDEIQGYPIRITLKDLDEDGDFDVKGIDFDFDGKIDEFESLLNTN